MVYSTHRNGDFGDGLWHCFTHIKKKHLDSQVVDFPLRNEKIMWVKQESA
jgi:hypothetical protein